MSHEHQVSYPGFGSGFRALGFKDLGSGEDGMQGMQGFRVRGRDSSFG